MLESIERLHQTRIARAVSRPVTTDEDSPAREAFLEVVRQRNAALDTLFYDVRVVTPEEAAKLSPWLAAEGAILIVPPTGQGESQICNSVEDFIDRDGAAVRAMAVAGVGSSALGSAAFARNVADAIDGPVAAVVSGYGLADVMTEALGGFLWFGTLNSLRKDFEWMDRLREDSPVADPLSSVTFGEEILVRQSRDTQTVYALLTNPALHFDLLVGHSKGNLVISEALFALKAARRAEFLTFGARVHIVTISAIIAMPLGCEHVFDVIGSLDNFGALNSRRQIPPDEIVRNAWHHTNTEAWWHLPVRSVMADLRPGASWEPSNRAPPTCDRMTMTQEDILNGRLLREIGIAPACPVEFENFRTAI